MYNIGYGEFLYPFEYLSQQLDILAVKNCLIIVLYLTLSNYESKVSGS